MTISRHVLSDNGWIDLRDQRSVSERLRRPIKARMAHLMADKDFARAVTRAQQIGSEGLAELPADEAEAITAEMAGQMTELEEVNDLLVLARVAAWSYGETVDVDTLLDMPGDIYDEIRALVAKGVGELMPDFSPTQVADSPIAPSTGSRRR